MTPPRRGRAPVPERLPDAAEPRPRLRRRRARRRRGLPPPGRRGDLRPLPGPRPARRHLPGLGERPPPRAPRAPPRRLRPAGDVRRGEDRQGQGPLVGRRARRRRPPGVGAGVVRPLIAATAYRPACHRAMNSRIASAPRSAMVRTDSVCSATARARRDERPPGSSARRPWRAPSPRRSPLPRTSRSGRPCRGGSRRCRSSGR